MDWSDDIAYSVHDLEDAVHAGHLDLAVLADADERAALTGLAAARWPDAAPADFAAALDRLTGLDCWPGSHDGSQRALAALKNTTSELIGRFCAAAEDATRAESGPGPLQGYAADLVVPSSVRHEVEVLKAVAARYVMETAPAVRRYAQQRELVHELVASLVHVAPGGLGPLARAAWDAAGDDSGRLRAVLDQVASLTDRSAVARHDELTAG